MCVGQIFAVWHKYVMNVSRVTCAGRREFFKHRFVDTVMKLPQQDQLLM